MAGAPGSAVDSCDQVGGCDTERVGELRHWHSESATETDHGKVSGLDPGVGGCGCDAEEACCVGDGHEKGGVVGHVPIMR